MSKKIVVNSKMVNRVKKGMLWLYTQGYIKNNIIEKNPNIHAPWSNTSDILSRREAEVFRNFLDIIGNIAIYDEPRKIWKIHNTIWNYESFCEKLDNGLNLYFLSN